MVKISKKWIEILEGDDYTPIGKLRYIMTGDMFSEEHSEEYVQWSERMFGRYRANDNEVQKMLMKMIVGVAGYEEERFYLRFKGINGRTVYIFKEGESLQTVRVEDIELIGMPLDSVGFVEDEYNKLSDKWKIMVEKVPII